MMIRTFTEDKNMNNKSGHVIRIILGAYLAYLGVRILMRVIEAEPSNSEIMGLLAVLFIVIGGGYAVFSIRNLIKIYKSENAKNSGLDETQELRIPGQAIDAGTAGSDRRADGRDKRKAAMQQVGPGENAAETGAQEEETDQESTASDISGGSQDNSSQDGTDEEFESKSAENGSEPEEADSKKENTDDDDKEETEKEQ